MIKYCVRRMVQLIITMILVSFFSFAVIYLAPGDVSVMYISQKMTEEQKVQIRKDLGVDKPMIEQYFGWVKKAVKGDWGNSFRSKTSVAEQFSKKLPVTILLMGTSIVIAVLFAIVFGLIAGYKRNTWIDNLISGISYIGMSIPSFWLGMLFIIIFTAKLHWLPSSGIRTGGVNSMMDLVKHLIMPSLTLSFANLASYTRYIRSNTITQLNEEYVLTAKAKGTSEMKILFKHVLKNTLLPLITLLGINISSIVCGSFIVESVFGWPGIGMYTMSAITARDYPVIMAYIMLSGSILVIGNFVADILYMLVDPRIRRDIDYARKK